MKDRKKGKKKKREGRGGGLPGPAMTEANVSEGEKFGTEIYSPAAAVAQQGLKMKARSQNTNGPWRSCLARKHKTALVSEADK